MNAIERETSILSGGGQTKRELWADIAKGIGVILVILGHTSQLSNIAIEWIFSFHMPLFFWISGYFYKDAESIASYAKKKFTTLIWPYFLYSIIFLIINCFVVREDRNLIINEILGGLSGQGTDGILWFFPALFWTEIIFFLLKKYTKEFLPISIIACVLCGNLFSGYTNYQSGFLKIPSALFAIGFYYCGWLTKSYDLLGQIRRMSLLVYLAFHLMLLAIFHPNLSLNTASTSNMITAYLIAVIGICGTVKLADGVISVWPKCIGRALAYIGENSVFYYPITGYAPVALVKILVTYGVGKNVIIVLASKAVGFAIATGVCFLEKKVMQSSCRR